MCLANCSNNNNNHDDDDDDDDDIVCDEFLSTVYLQPVITVCYRYHTL